MDDIKYPEKKHDNSKKPEPAVPAPAMGESPEQPSHTLDVRSGVAEASHQPFVSVIVDGEAIRLAINDAANMAMTLLNQMHVASQDSIVCAWLEQRFGMDRLGAYQEMMKFQEFRRLLIAQTQAMQQAAQRKAREG